MRTFSVHMAELYMRHSARENFYISMVVSAKQIEVLSRKGPRHSTLRMRTSSAHMAEL